MTKKKLFLKFELKDYLSLLRLLTSSFAARPDVSTFFLDLAV